jgi:hypothetical protein
VVEMAAAGDVSDYGDAEKAALTTSFALLAGVDPSQVAVDIQPASVRVIVTIHVANAAAATSLVSALSATLTDARAASAFTGLEITSSPTLSVRSEVRVVEAVQRSGRHFNLWWLMPIALNSSLLCGLLAVYWSCLRTHRRAGSRGCGSRRGQARTASKQGASPRGNASRHRMVLGWCSDPGRGSVSSGSTPGRQIV